MLLLSNPQNSSWFINCPMMLFTVKGSYSESHVSYLVIMSLVSFWNSFSFLFTFQDSDILKSIIQLFFGTSFNLDLFHGQIRLCIFWRNIVEGILWSFHCTLWFMIFVCPITYDVSFDHLVRAVQARHLHYKVTLFFIVVKNFVRMYFEIM